MGEYSAGRLLAGCNGRKCWGFIFVDVSMSDTPDMLIELKDTFPW